MALTNLPMRIDARRNNNESSTKYGRIYPALYLRGCLSTGGLVEHMAEHGSLVTGEVLALVLAQLKKCIPELLSQGYSVELEGLGIFYPTIKSSSTAGKSDVETFIATPCDDMIDGVFMRFLPIGDDVRKLRSKYFAERCTFEKGDYVKVNLVVDSQTGKKTTWTERIPLDKWDEYKANGGSAVPTRPTD
jgi:nucleoid DNA-binding protein